MFVEIANLSTKPSPIDDGLVARLSISTNMRHKPDLYAASYGTIVCPIKHEVTYYQGIIGEVHTIHTTRTLVAYSACNVNVITQVTSLT